MQENADDLPLGVPQTLPQRFRWRATLHVGWVLCGRTVDCCQGACRGALGIASPKYLLSPEETKTVTQFADYPILLSDGPARAAVAASHGSAYLGAHGEVLVLGDHHSLCAPLQLHRDTGMMLVVVEGSLLAMDEIEGAVGATHGARIDAICRIDSTERERE